MLPGVDVRAEAIVGVLSCILPGSVLPPASVWVGLPAACVDSGATAPAAVNRDGTLRARQTLRTLLQERSSLLLASQPAAKAAAAAAAWRNPRLLILGAAEALLPAAAGVALLTAVQAGPLAALLLLPLTAAIIGEWDILLHDQGWLRWRPGHLTFDRACLPACLPARVPAAAAAAAATVVGLKHVLGPLDLASTTLPAEHRALAALQQVLHPALDWLAGTEAAAGLLRALGASVGRGAYVGQLPGVGHELITVGSGAIINGVLEVVTLGLAGIDVSETSVASRAAVGDLAHVSAGAELEQGTVVGAGAVIAKVSKPGLGGPRNRRGWSVHVFTCPWFGGSGSHLQEPPWLLPMLLEVHHAPDAACLSLLPAGPSVQPWRVL